MKANQDFAADARSAAKAALHILLVEDDAAQRADYRSALEASGWKIRAVSSAEAGIFEAQNGAFDLILTDNVLPGMTGLRSLAEYANCTKAPVIVMTSHFSEDLAKDGKLLGARSVLAKPLNGERLRSAILAAADASLP